MSQGFSFMRQKRAFLLDMQFSFTYTINPDFAKDCFFPPGAARKTWRYRRFRGEMYPPM